MSGPLVFLGTISSELEGYSVFSVSKSQEPVLRKYIASQAEHHAAHDFKAELLGLLRAHGVEFEERWVFD